MLELYKNIKARREQLGMSQAQLAEILGYTSKSSISKIESGINDIPQSKIVAFAEALHTTAGELMGLDGVQPTVPPGFDPLPPVDYVPRVGQIACGTPILAEENIEEIVAVPQKWHATFTLLCQGDSMSPRIQDGDLVAIRKQPAVENGEIAAVRIGEEATLKHVFIFPDHIELRADNPTYPTIIKTGADMVAITIEGKAVGLCRGL